jgi:two-component system, cell cycle response regulator
MRIVLTDPSRTMLRIVTQLLQSGGHQVRSFTDPSDALVALESDHQVGAIIASAELVGMSGVELCWRARLLAGPNRSIFVVMMSSDGERRHLVQALDAGADDFVSKPPKPEELHAKLRVADRLASMQNKLASLASTDPLTQVRNRRAFFERANELLRTVEGRPLKLFAIMMDIDHFKGINDTYGHQMGDVVLHDVAQAAAGVESMTGRLGGEEFAMLLKEQTLAEAVRTAELIRSRVADLEFTKSSTTFRVTCSLGVSELRCGDTVDELLSRADAALYQAKASGRNRVVGEGVAGICKLVDQASSVVRTERR